MSEQQFRYTYSAPTESERREIEDIQKQYAPADPADDKMARMRRLNARVRNISVSAAISLGIVGLLLFGAGMSLTLSWGYYLAGILTSVAGIAVMAAANPVYKAVLKKCKNKYGEEILRLTRELLNEHK